MIVLKQIKKNLVSAALILSLVVPASAQLGSNCSATIANRSVQVNADGTYAIPNIPTDVGLYRVRVVCKNPDGTATHGQSGFVSLAPNSNTNISRITFGTVTPPPVSLSVLVPQIVFTTIGQMAQITPMGTFPDGSSSALGTQALGTLYVSSNSNIAAVSSDGFVTAVARGSAIITITNEGASTSVQINVNTPISTLNDGIPDSWKIAHGFDPNDPSVASADTDNDGLTNLQEFQLGTDPRNPDTDGDGDT